MRQRRQLGRHIRERRERAGIGLNQFARLAGLDPGSLSRIERGVAGLQGDPRLSHLVKIARRLEVALSDLLCGAGL